MRLAPILVLLAVMCVSPQARAQVLPEAPGVGQGVLAPADGAPRQTGAPTPPALAARDTARSPSAPNAAPGLSAPEAVPGLSAPEAARGLSARDAATILEILNDPQRRAAFTAQLEAFVRAVHPGQALPPQAPPATAPAMAAPVAAPVAPAPAQATPPAPAPTAPPAAPPAASAPPAKPAAAPALTPGSLGATAIARGAGWAAALGSQVTELTRLLGNLPGLWRFLTGLTRDADTRAQLLRAAWQTAAVLGGAGLIGWAIRRLLDRPIGALGRMAERAAPGRVAPAAQDQGASTPERRFTRLLRVLRRLPFIVLRAVLELVSVAVFVGLGYAGLILADAGAQDVMSIGVFAYAGAALVLAATRVAVSPAPPMLRMVQLNDQGAAYVVRWMRRLSILAALGYATVSIGNEFGMPRSAQDALVKAFSLVGHLLLVVIVLQSRRSVAAAIAHGASDSRVGAELRRRLAARWHLLAIFFILALWVVWAAQLRNGMERVGRFFLITVGILVLSRVLNTVLLGGLDRLVAAAPGNTPGYAGLEARADRYLPVMRGFLSGFVTVLTILALLQSWGVGTLAWFGRGTFGQLLLGAIGGILLTALLLIAVWEGVNALLERHLARLTREAQMVRSARLRTLLPIMRAVLGFALVAIFALSTLSRIGVDIGPLLAGAGILGVAIGFGSQKLVQDFITGIFLLLENAMQVGDWVTVAGLSGSVEKLSIRTMKLRAGDGAVHLIPFSSVTTVTNVNRGIGNVPVSITVPAEADTDRVAELLGEVAKAMRAERRYEGMMRSDFQLWGVDKLEAGAATIVGQIVCSDEGRWPVQREFNRRVNIRFREVGLRIVAPAQRVIYAAAAEGHAQPAGDRPPPPPHIAHDAGETEL